MNEQFDTDVFVIGAGPAGLCAAIAARRKGLRVIIADAAQFPVDKACGEGLLPGAVEALQALGVEWPSRAGIPFYGIRFLENQFAVEASFPGGEAGRGIRRTELHHILERHARALGVELICGARVTGMDRSAVKLNGAALRARWIVAADGLKSRARRWAGLDGQNAPVRYGFRRHFAVRPWTRHVEVYWGERCQAYVTPTGESEICIAILSSMPQKRVQDALALFPRLAARVGGAFASAETGGISAFQKIPRVSRDNLALIGDASGSVDAVTGDGLRLAFQQAIALGEALERGNLAHYEAAHTRIWAGAAAMSRLLLLLSEHQNFRRRVFAAFAARRELFSGLLAQHAAQSAPYARNFASLGWQMLVAPRLRRTA